MAASNKANYNTSHIVLTFILLIGILITTYGYFQQERLILIIGLLVIVAGVLNGILKIVINRK